MEKKVSRRQFLKSTGAVVAGAAVGTSLMGLSGCATAGGGAAGAAQGAAGFGGWAPSSPSPIFDAINIGSLALKNRMLLGAMNKRRATTDGNPTPSLMREFNTLAAGGAAMLITGLTYILKEDQFASTPSGFYDDSQIPLYRELTDGVHRNGSKICIQLVVNGSRTSFNIENRRTFAPAPLTDPSSGVVVTAGMTREEIRELIDAHVRAALRSREAGFDAVQFHFANNYQVCKFFAPYFNTRTDEYGGPDIANRARFGFEIAEAVRRAMGRDYPLLVKMNGPDFFGRRGNTQDEINFIAQGLRDRGIDAIEVSGGTNFQVRDRNIVRYILNEEDQNYFARSTRAIGEGTNVPLVMTGGVRNVVMMERALRQIPNLVAFSMARTLLAEPDLPFKWQQDTSYTPKCTSCNWCHGTRWVDGIEVSLQCIFRKDPGFPRPAGT